MKLFMVKRYENIYERDIIVMSSFLSLIEVVFRVGDSQYFIIDYNKTAKCLTHCQSQFDIRVFGFSLEIMRLKKENAICMYAVLN